MKRKTHFYEMVNVNRMKKKVKYNAKMIAIVVQKKNVRYCFCIENVLASQCQCD